MKSSAVRGVLGGGEHGNFSVAWTPGEVVFRAGEVKSITLPAGSEVFQIRCTLFFMAAGHSVEFLHVDKESGDSGVFIERNEFSAYQEKTLTWEAVPKMFENETIISFKSTAAGWVFWPMVKYIYHGVK